VIERVKLVTVSQQPNFAKSEMTEYPTLQTPIFKNA